MTDVFLCPLRQHPELAGFDDDGLQLFCDVLGLEMYRNWDAAPATDLAGAWRVRQHLDDEAVRQAQAADLRLAVAELDQAARLGPLHRRLEAQARRAAAIAAIDADQPIDSRFAAWDAEMSDRGEARFLPGPPAPEQDDRTLVERLKDKVAGR